VTPEELPGFLRALQERAAHSAPPVVMAMADAYRDRVKVNLHRYEHAEFTKTPSPPGGFPAKIGGELAASVTAALGPSSGTDAHASVAPHTIYARLQELGGEVHARRRRFLMWKTDYPTSATAFWKSEREGGGLFLNFAKHVTIPRRPYMRPTTEDMVRDGSLTAEAIGAFIHEVWA